ncbi:hypothetical protein GCM10027521_32680 [Amycolatopsis cihanbeyliensis]
MPPVSQNHSRAPGTSRKPSLAGAWAGIGSGTNGSHLPRAASGAAAEPVVAMAVPGATAAAAAAVAARTVRLAACPRPTPPGFADLVMEVPQVVVCLGLCSGYSDTRRLAREDAPVLLILSTHRSL